MIKSKGEVGALIVAVFFVLTLATICFADDKTKDEGLFSKGSFLSEAINSAADKLGNVTSGGEKIVSNDAKGVPQDTLEYDADPLGRPLPKPSFHKKRGEV